MFSPLFLNQKVVYRLIFFTSRLSAEGPVCIGNAFSESLFFKFGLKMSHTTVIVSCQWLILDPRLTDIRTKRGCEYHFYVESNSCFNRFDTHTLSCAESVAVMWITCLKFLVVFIIFCCFLFLSLRGVEVWCRAGVSTWWATLCDAVSVCGFAMSVHQRLHTDSGGPVVVQVVLPRSHARHLPLPRHAGGPELWVGVFGSPRLWGQRADGPHCSVWTGVVHHPRWVLQGPRHLHH